MTVLTLIPFTRDSIRYQRIVRNHKPESYDFPDISSLKLTLAATAFFAAADMVAKKVLPPLFKTCCKEQKDLEVRESRCLKAAGQAYTFVYAVSVTCWGYQTLKD